VIKFPWVRMSFCQQKTVHARNRVPERIRLRSGELHLVLDLHVQQLQRFERFAWSVEVNVNSSIYWQRY
jgi:hypothetical protein